jgi:hypothetical protein
MTPSDDIQLAPPGAGLPRFQGLLLRYMIFPVFCRLTSWDEAAAFFQEEGKKLVELAQPLSPELFEKRVLVKPILGIEDSSRYWSAEMVLEHLIEVGTRIATGVVELSHGQDATVEADIVAVKPKGGHGRQVLDDYIGFLTDYKDTLASDVGDRRSKSTLSHPWFGDLAPHHWVCLGAVHQRIHRRQMEQIVAGLGEAG